MVRVATLDDLPAIRRLLLQLNTDDPPLADDVAAARFAEIVGRAGLDILVLEIDGSIVATTYLNIIPNLSRSARPYAVIENVVVEESLRGTGAGKRIMAATLDRAWEAGCYKAMLMTGSRRESTHAFYRACGFSPDAKHAFLARPPS